MTDELTTVYLGLGSNVGDRQQHLSDALASLTPDVLVDEVAALYETVPVGPQDQQDFYNTVCRGSTALAPLALLAHVKRIERELGRTAGRRWGPRVIDIDLLLYGDEVVDEPELHIPHVELVNRAFALTPLAEIAAEVTHPVAQKTIATLLGRVDATGVRLLAGAGWEC